MQWLPLHRRAKIEMLGLIPAFLSESDPRSASEQINANYSHGGGWRPISGFRKLPGEDGIPSFQYPGDPPLFPLFSSLLRDELLIFFAGEWLAIVQKNGDFEISRID